MSERDVRPVDALNPRARRVTRTVRKDRLDICRSCDKYMWGERCSLCGCIMPIKTGLADASCPIGKWKSEPK